METLFYCLQMLVEKERVEQNMIKGLSVIYEDVHPSQSTDHVNAPQDGECVILMDGQRWLPYVQAPASEITSTVTVLVLPMEQRNQTIQCQHSSKLLVPLKLAVILMKDFSALPIKKLRITNLLEMRLVSSLL
jgi:hypothetical protein